jgi:hypothetical protein
MFEALHEVEEEPEESDDDRKKRVIIILDTLWLFGTQDEEKKNMTQYVLDTTGDTKQSRLESIRVYY